MKTFSISVVAMVIAGVFSGCATPKTAPGALKKLKTADCSVPETAKRPVLLWSTEGFSAPESVVYDAEKSFFYVSNVDGSPVAKDGRGWLSKLAKDGKMIKPKWVDGSRAISKRWKGALNAPKGLAWDLHCRVRSARR